MYNWRRAFLVAAAVVLPVSSIVACNIPVFRYALENWQPDPYRIAVVHRGELTADQDAVFRALQQSSSHPSQPANVVVFNVDLDEQADDDDRREIPEVFERLVRYEFKDKDVDQPTIALYFPDGTTRSIWQGELSKANAAKVIDSPLRQEVTKRLVDGESAVWILIKSGDAAKDELAEKVLAEKLQVANKKVLLPDQSLIEAEEEFRADNPIELRVEFSMLVVDRNDPVEAPFVSMLINSEDDIAEFDEPIAIPIFGRGRTYFALIGKGINEDNVLDNCGFVCGACSCQVKQANPGIDTLMAFDWSAKITGSAMPDVKLPELTGIGDLLANHDVLDESSPEPESSDAVISTTSDVSVQSDSVAADTVSEDVEPAPVQAVAQTVDPSAARSDNVEQSVERPRGMSTLMVLGGGAGIVAVVVFLISLFLPRSA